MKINAERTKLMLAFVILCVLLAVVVVYYVLGWRMQGNIGNGYYDLHLHYSVNADFLRPQNHHGDTSFIKYPAVPWSLILGQSFYAGFMSVRHAEILIAVLHYVVYALSVLLLCSHLKKYLADPVITALCLLPAAHFSYAYSMYFGNEGAIICLLMIDVIFIIRKHPYISGVLISLCMCKPQIAGIICLVFLLRGHVKPLVIGAVICLGAWFAASVITQTTMLQLLQGCMNAGMYDENYVGPFQLLALAGVNKNIALGLSMFTGIIYTVLVYAYLRKNVQSAEIMHLAAYVPACAASTVWMFKNGGDYLILIYPAAFGLLMCLLEKVSRKDFVKIFLCTAYLLLSRYIVTFFIALSSKDYLSFAVFGDISAARTICKSLDGIIIMIVGVMLCRMLVKYQEE